MRNSNIQTGGTKVLVENGWWRIFGGNALFDINKPLLLKSIAYIGSTFYLSFSVYVCFCLCICLFVSIRLGHCHHQMISFQKIYGLYGLKHHSMEINGDVTMETNEQTNKK